MHRCWGMQVVCLSCKHARGAHARSPKDGAQAMVHKLHAQADRQIALALTKSAVLNWKTPCSSCLPYVTTQTISIRTLKLGLPMKRKGVTRRHTCSQHHPDRDGSPDTCCGSVWEAQCMLQPHDVRNAAQPLL